jgi:hypothetical protein
MTRGSEEVKTGSFSRESRDVILIIGGVSIFSGNSCGIE